jgi:hypothetical protein
MRLCEVRRIKLVGDRVTLGIKLNLAFTDFDEPMVTGHFPVPVPIGGVYAAQGRYEQAESFLRAAREKTIRRG